MKISALFKLFTNIGVTKIVIELLRTVKLTMSSISYFFTNKKTNIFHCVQKYSVEIILRALTGLYIKTTSLVHFVLSELKEEKKVDMFIVRRT